MLMLMLSLSSVQYVTKNGVAEFIYYLQTYDANFNYNDDDDGYASDNLPNCEANDYGYMGLDCSSDGSFAINYYNDEYCVSRTGNQYNQLKNVNKEIGNYESCVGAYSYGDDTDYSLVHNLLYYSEPCTSMDYSACEDSAAFDSRSSSSGSGPRQNSSWSSAYMGGHKSWVTKLKYVVGGLFLLASFIMFTGILFTNRRRRRAMMMRKYRQAKKQKREKGGRDSSSRKSRSGSKRRSKSKSKDKDGVFI
jgi:hypothetical protein